MVWDTPALLLDMDKLEYNLRDMADFCRSKGIRLRPHIKAHKSVELALLQLRYGAEGITTAKLGEAEIMAAGGIRDIFIANQLTGAAKLQRLAALAQQARVQVGLDDWGNAQELNEMAREYGIVQEVLIEIDTGLHRCGLEPGKQVFDLAAGLLQLPTLKFKGIYTHAGHAYAASSPQEVQDIGTHEGQVMAELGTNLRREGIPVEVISVGSTPTAKFTGLVPGVTELRPGNYVFNDAIQVTLGTTTADNCALRVMATVISRPAPDRAVIDAGSKTLNLDKGAHGNSLVSGFGIVVGRPSISIARLSEEHGILALDPGADLRVGDVLEIIPNHACTVVNLFNTILTTRDGRSETELTVSARGQVK